MPLQPTNRSRRRAQSKPSSAAVRGWPA